MRTATEILERFENSQNRLSDSHLKSEFGFDNSRSRKTKGKRCLPYWDWDSLTKVRDTGRWLATKPTIISATEKLISYVVKNGHQYTVSPRSISSNKRRQKASVRAAELMESDIEFVLEELCWFELQIETYSRLIRDGECFRRIWGSGDDIDITFIEPEWIRQPENLQSTKQIINIDDVPEGVVTRPRPGLIEIAGTLGIVRDPEDSRKTIGFWEHYPNHFPNGMDGWMWHSSKSVQHLKDGVDKTDPRGVPRFYWALYHIVSIDEVNSGMVDLSLVQAEHAAIYKFDSLVSTQQSILDAANNRVKAQTRSGGRPESPGVKHVKGMDVEIPGMKISAKDFVEIIQQQQRLAGGVSDIPEYMITADANTGNRSSLVSAEGPFDRRVQREQIRLFHMDRQILWMMVSDATRNAVSRRDFRIIPDFPIAASRDMHKEIASHISLVDSKLESKKQARKKLDIEHRRAESEIEEEKNLPSADVPEPEPANNSD